MSKKINPSELFAIFLQYFPRLDPPLTLTEDSIQEISKINKPFSQLLINEIILPLENEIMDEYTEFIPCFKFPEEKDYVAVVYWKGQLMKYDFFLVTFNKSGNLISRKSIAGIRVEQDQIMTSVATVDEDGIIHVIIGSKAVDDISYNPSNSQAMSLEILPSGDIIFSLQS